jgi:hypothetical protein
MKKKPTSRQKKTIASMKKDPNEWFCIKTEDSGRIIILQNERTGEILKLPK